MFFLGETKKLYIHLQKIIFIQQSDLAQRNTKNKMQNNTPSSFLIAAPKSNSGKTLITLGLINLLTNKGLKVQTFKCGPDYIDPMHHRHISGNAAYNLDLWMASPEHVKSIYNNHASCADIAITEGVMGLFDGARKSIGSSAAVAKYLSLPVILVVDVSGVAYSIAPLLYGFKNFDQDINLAGVIFNKVASESHYQFLKDAADDAGVESFGYLPRNKDLAIESRHLGLHLPAEQNGMKTVNLASSLLEKHVNIEKLLSSCKANFKNEAKNKENKPLNFKKKIAIAEDAAFNFTYQANIDVLQEMGELVKFSPLNDSELPEADLVWLPGGYPELFAEELAANTKMKQSIINFVESGKALVAECGGMMYLGETMELQDGSIHNMAGLFSYKTSLKAMKLRLGYRQVYVDNIELKCHEFHFSELTQSDLSKEKISVFTARKKELEMSVFRKKNCWASYAHLYLGEYEKMKEFLERLEF